MPTITIELHTPPASMPYADTDVLIWDDSSPEAQLGAYVGLDESATGWVDAQGADVSVTRWAELPRLPARSVAAAADKGIATLRDGSKVDLHAPWVMPR